VDEVAYRSAYRAANPIACPFEKALVAKRCFCEKAVRLNIAEREVAGCSSADIAADCGTLLDLLRHNAQFALHLTHVEGGLPHAKEMKVQCGGLLGLQGVLEPDWAGTETVENVFGLVREAVERFGDLDSLPYGEIVKTVSAFEIRRRPGRR
jgi:hypothetical protein